jgi:uncharacterized membrane protein
MKTKRLSTLLALGVALTLTLSASQAFAWLQFCNHTNTTVWVDYAHWMPDCEGHPGWNSRGWWQLAPNECKIVQGGTLQSSSLSRYYYFHAEGADGRYWSGNYFFHANRSAFSEYTCIGHTTNGDCPSCDGYDEGMREFDISSYDNYTMNLN